MLTQSTRKKLTLWLTAMLLLHIFLAWRSWGGVEIGLPDFSIFYTAGVILHEGHGYELYDDRVQEAVQRSFSPIGLQKRGSILPFNHPPFEALVFIPFARLPYIGAYLVWLGINLGLTFAVLVLLRRNFVILGSAPFYLWMLAGFRLLPAVHRINARSGFHSRTLLLHHGICGVSSWIRIARRRMGGIRSMQISSGAFLLFFR